MRREQEDVEAPRGGWISIPRFSIRLVLPLGFRWVEWEKVKRLEYFKEISKVDLPIFTSSIDIKLNTLPTERLLVRIENFIHKIVVEYEVSISQEDSRERYRY